MTSEGRILSTLLDERLFLESFGLSFPSHHKLYQIFNDKTQQLFESGIFQRYSYGSDRWLDPKRYAHLYRDEPQVLTMNNLEAGFIIWLASLSLTLFAFVCEWIIRIMEFVICKSIFKAFYKQQMNLSAHQSFLERTASAHSKVSKVFGEKLGDKVAKESEDYDTIEVCDPDSTRNADDLQNRNSKSK